MKTIQARLQSRISLRAIEIRTFEDYIKDRQSVEVVSRPTMKAAKNILKDLQQNQKLDKDLIRNIYWGNV